MTGRWSCRSTACGGSTPASRFDAGDRTLVAVRPPIFDSPTTRGLYDSKTGVYWAVGQLRLAPARPRHRVRRRPRDELWRDSFTFFAQMVSPWVALTDPAKFVETVDEIARARHHRGRRRPHGRACAATGSGEALGLLRQLPSLPMAPLPGQADLDAMLAAHRETAA